MFPLQIQKHILYPRDSQYWPAILSPFLWPFPQRESPPPFAVLIARIRDLADEFKIPYEITVTSTEDVSSSATLFFLHTQTEPEKAAAFLTLLAYRAGLPLYKYKQVTLLKHRARPMQAAPSTHVLKVQWNFDPNDNIRRGSTILFFLKEYQIGRLAQATALGSLFAETTALLGILFKTRGITKIILKFGESWLQDSLTAIVIYPSQWIEHLIALSERHKVFGNYLFEAATRVHFYVHGKGWNALALAVDGFTPDGKEGNCARITTGCEPNLLGLIEICYSFHC